jgi:hypothetical protein
MRYRLKHKPLWRRDGPVEPGEIVEPTEAELRAFPDRFEAVDDPADGAQVPAGQAYGLVERGGGWWDVVRADGHRVTATALRRRHAEALLRDLQEATEAPETPAAEA